MEKFWNGFAAGMTAIAAIQSLRQDYIGKEAYLMEVDIHWASAAITVPIALILLLFVFITILGESLERER